jgi:hypothetical protein
VARTTGGKVRTILDHISRSAKDTAALASAIQTAYVFLTRVCVTTGVYDEEADKALLAELETYLAAHFFCIFRPQKKTVNVAGVQQTSDSKVDLGLRQTRYGQQAKLLDVKGVLREQDEAKIMTSIGMISLGSEV